jgi:serine-type D-Ala-D-Ala carboxypeptidase/endopeptidase (penicillin-binding protein 4)
LKFRFYFSYKYLNFENYYTIKYIMSNAFKHIAQMRQENCTHLFFKPLLLAFCFFYTPSVFGQLFTLDNAIQHLAGDDVMRRGQTGICVMDVQSGQMLGSFNSSMSLIPASNMKIVTTAAGLKMLGCDFTFRTDLQYDGDIKDSILHGNIIIKGYGDPTLGSPLMDSIVRIDGLLSFFSAKIKALGIKKVQGRVIGDGSAFEKATATQTWLWEDLGNYYGAGPSGLNFHENLYKLNFTQNPSVGSPPSLSGIYPHVPDFMLYNEVTSAASSDDDAYIYSSPYARVGVVRGTIPAGSNSFSINGSLPDPPYFAAWHLRKTLMDDGIDVTDSAATQIWFENRGVPLPSRKTFFTWRSPTLETIVNRTNQESVNLYCEAILRTIAFQQTGYGSNEKGTELVTKFWQSKGVDTEGLFMQDGSGLSPRNGITPYQLTSMLRTVALDSQWFKPFYKSLPEAGHSGTMKNMFKGYPSVIGRIRAKSGTISRVRAYSGYATATDGRLIAFSVVLNNFTCSQTEIRKRLEKFMAELLKL